MELSRLKLKGPIRSAGGVFESEAKEGGSACCWELFGGWRLGAEARRRSGHVAQTNLLFRQIRRRGIRIPVSVSAGTLARSGALTNEGTKS
jgi:hypothetical protein